MKKTLVRFAGVSAAVAAIAVAGAGAASASTVDHNELDVTNNGYVHTHAPDALVYAPIDVQDVGVGVLGAGVGELGNAVVGLLSNTGAVAD